jgi:hypothetical protein
LVREKVPIPDREVFLGACARAELYQMAVLFSGQEGSDGVLWIR